jgi:hypothetical protein
MRTPVNPAGRASASVVGGISRAIISASAVFAYGTVGNDQKVLANFDVHDFPNEILLEAVA